jgi:hypothetical protein
MYDYRPIKHGDSLIGTGAELHSSPGRPRPHCKTAFESVVRRNIVDDAPGPLQCGRVPQPHRHLDLSNDELALILVPRVVCDCNGTDCIIPILPFVIFETVSS